MERADGSQLVLLGSFGDASEICPKFWLETLPRRCQFLDVTQSLGLRPQRTLISGFKLRRVVEVLSIPDLKRGGTLYNPVDQGIVDAVEHDQPRAGGTLLPLEAERGLHRIIGSTIQVTCVINNEGILAAHLHVGPLQPALRVMDPCRPLSDAKPDLL